jgi:hypothetical protein
MRTITKPLSAERKAETATMRAEFRASIREAMNQERLAAAERIQNFTPAPRSAVADLDAGSYRQRKAEVIRSLRGVK